jgi:hypothetical protein
MRRRLFRRAAASGAVVSGITGIAANLLLILYFALAKPWNSGHDGPWEWMGPANDIVGAVSIAALIPVVAHLSRRLRHDRLIVILGVGSVLAMAAGAVAGPLLVTGQISLETQFVVAGIELPILFGWLLRVSRTGGRAGILPASLARFGERIGAGALLGTALAVLSFALPWGSIGQYALLGLAALAGLPAYLAFPVWALRLGRALAASARTDVGQAIVRTSTP